MEKRETVETDDLLKPDDCVSITPRNIEAAAPTPLLRKTRTYLLKQGFTQEAGTGGDHENWRSPQGAPLKLNPDNKDKKVLDLASFKACATLLNTNINDLYMAIMSPS